MARRVWPGLASGMALLAMAGCGVFERAERPAWRAQAENACIAQKLVVPSAYVTPAPAIDGPGICGLEHPFKVSAIADGSVALEKSLILDCSMVPALEAWLAD